jgi:hypothetical protein
MIRLFPHPALATGGILGFIEAFFNGVVFQTTMPALNWSAAPLAQPEFRGSQFRIFE